MRIGFFSGSEISIPFLDALHNEVYLVITTPPKVRGRGKTLRENPVKSVATKYGIDVIEVESFTNEVISRIASYNLDSFVVFSFGKILPGPLLNMVKCPLNIHPSDLPLYRGASPIERQLMDGVNRSAVTIIKMNENIDAGDIIKKGFFDVSLFDDYYSFLNKVYTVGIPLIKEALECCLNSTCQSIPQEGVRSYAKKIKREEEKIDWNSSAISIHNKIRALTRVGAFTCFRGLRLKIYKTEPILSFDRVNYLPGTIVEIGKDFLIILANQGAVKVLELQLEGKRRMLVKEFINGYKPKVGEVLNENCGPR